LKIEDIYKVISLLDLTRLSETTTEAEITALCQKAVQPQTHVAAVCIPEAFVSQATKMLVDSSVKIATVANFPQGTDTLDDVINSIAHSIQAGADEIDVVFPYTRYLKGEKQAACDFIQACKAACGNNILLKVILETGILQEPDIIAEVSRNVLLAGADFLKTSTGKVAVGATLTAATSMLEVIREMSNKTHQVYGLKVSGGVNSLDLANQYMSLAKNIMGESFVTAKTFRIGTSQLYDVAIDLLKDAT